jgi:hypothetical protein
MGKLKSFVAICTLFLSLLNVNTSDGQSPKSRPTAVNIIVILDTSDRVSNEKHPGQVERDRNIVKEIVARFEEVVKVNVGKSTEFAYQDQLTIIVPDQPTVPPIPLKIMMNLTIEDLGDYKSVSEIHEDLKKTRDALPSELSKLYEFVQEHKQTGSDIWDWFQYEAVDYLSAAHQNLIICLSDGYLIFDKNIQDTRRKGTYMDVRTLRDTSDWRQKIQGSEGLLVIPEARETFSGYNVKFLMAGILLQTAENGIPYQQDFEIIKAYWETWLNAMGIKETDFVKQGRPLQKKLQLFISPESN